MKNILIAFFPCLLFSTMAFAQTANETKALVSRIDQLESQIQSMGGSGYSGGGDRPPGLAPASGLSVSGSNPVANLEVRLTGLEDQMRTLNGQVEKQNYDGSQLKTRLDKMQGDLEQRLTSLEQKPSAATAAAVSPPAAPADNSLQSDRNAQPTERSLTDDWKPPADKDDKAKSPSAAATPDQEYDAAYAQLQRRDYIGADAAFRAFIKKHPANNLDSNAQYWLGESLYARGKYNEAAAAFAEGYSKYPKGAKAPDTLLKLGVSLGDAKKVKEACTVFRQLAKDFPTAPEAIATRAENEMKKQKCP